MKSGPVVIEEHWNKPAGGTLLGLGRTLKGDRTLFKEFVSITRQQDKLVYTARIGTKNQTDFPLKQGSATELIFENLTHDFPQRIIYRKSAEGLFARIEGTKDGKERHEDFPYRRVPCE